MMLLIAIAAAALLLAAIVPAAAAPVLVGVLAAAGITGTAATVITLVASVALSIGASLLMRALQPKAAPTQTGISFEVQMGDTSPVGFCLGQTATAGKRVYIGSWGDDAKTPNAYLVDVIQVGDLPAPGQPGLWLNGKKCTILWNEMEFRGAPVQEFRTDPGGPNQRDHLFVRYRDGTAATADAYLRDKFGDHPTRPWKETMIGRGCPHLIITARVNRDLFTGSMTWLIEPPPIALYDVRKDSTAGGAGDHRWDDPATWEPSLNPAVCAYNIARGIYYGDEWIFGGQGLSPARLPAAAWMAAANACDEVRVLDDDSEEPQFRCGLEISGDKEPLDVIEELMKACSGRLAEVGGVIKPLVGAPGAAVYSFTDADIIITEGQSFAPFPPLDQTHNAVEATYPEPADAWAMKDAPSLYSEALEEDDGDRRLVASVSFDAAPFAAQVQQLMRTLREDARRFRVHSFFLPPDAYVLEPNDVVAWTSARNGYTDKKFLVERITGLPSLNQLVLLREMDPADYDPPGSFEPPSTGPVGPVEPPPQTVGGWAVAPATIDDDDGSRRPSIQVTFAADLDDVRAVMIQVRLASTAALVFETDFPYGDAATSGTRSVVLNGVFLPEVGYEVRGRLRPFGGRPTEWTSWLPVTTPAVRFVADDIDVGQIITDHIVDNAITAAKLLDGAVTAGKIGAGELALVHFATGIRPVEILSSLPATGNFAGRTVFLTTDHKIYRHTGSPAGASGFTVSVQGQDIVAGSITAAQIAVGAVGADQIAANAVAARHILVTDFTNLLENPNFDKLKDGIPGGWTIAGTGVSIFTSGAGAGYNGSDYFLRLQTGTGTATNDNLEINVRPGDELLVTAAIRRFNTVGIMEGSAIVRVRWVHADGSLTTGPQINIADVKTLNNNWVTLYDSGTATNAAPSTVRFARLEVVNGVTGGTVGLGGLGLYRRANASLIVDGTISAAKIVAGSIGARELAAKSITTEKLVMSDFSNLLDNPAFETGVVDGQLLGWGTGGGSGNAWGSGGLNVNATGYNSPWYIRVSGTTNFTSRSRIRIDPGTQLMGMVVARRSAAPTGNVVARLRFLDSSGSLVTGGSITQNVGTVVGTDWTRLTWNATAPANSATVHIDFNCTLTAQTVDIGYVGIFRRGTAELIVDGAIVAGKIAAGAINVGTIIADEIIVGGHLVTGAATNWSLGTNTLSVAQTINNGNELVGGSLTTVGRTNGATSGLVKATISTGGVTISSGASGAILRFELRINGTAYREFAIGTVNDGGTYRVNFQIHLMKILNVSVGSQTATLVYTGPSGVQTETAWALDMVMEELRR